MPSAVARGQWRLPSDEHSAVTLGSVQLRQSLEAIRKNAQAADLRAKLSEKLERALTRLDRITERTVELTVVLREQQVRFTDAVLEIKVLRALPPSD